MPPDESKNMDARWNRGYHRSWAMYRMLRYFNDHGIAIHPWEYVDSFLPLEGIQEDVANVEPLDYTKNCDELLVRIADLLYTGSFISVNRIYAPMLPRTAAQILAVDPVRQRYLMSMGRPLPTRAGWLIEIHKWKEDFVALAESLRTLRHSHIPFKAGRHTELGIEWCKVIGYDIRQRLECYMDYNYVIANEHSLMYFEDFTKQVRTCLTILRIYWVADLQHALFGKLMERMGHPPPCCELHGLNAFSAYERLFWKKPGAGVPPCGTIQAYIDVRRARIMAAGLSSTSMVPLSAIPLRESESLLGSESPFGSRRMLERLQARPLSENLSSSPRETESDPSSSNPDLTSSGESDEIVCEGCWCVECVCHLSRRYCDDCWHNGCICDVEGAPGPPGPTNSNDTAQRTIA